MKNKKAELSKQETDATLQQVKSIMMIVDNFSKTYGFDSWDYGCLYSSNEWGCSFFKNKEDDKPALYFLEPSVNALIDKLQNYSK